VARGFARAGVTVHLVARGPDPGIEGVRFHAASGLEHQKRLRAVSMGVRTISVLWRQRRLAGRLYARHNWTTVPGMLAGRLLGYRVVSEVDDVPFGRGYEGQIGVVTDYFKRAMTIAMGRLSHGVVAGTEEAKQLLSDEFHIPRARIGVVPIGVDVAYFRPLDRSEALARTSLDPAFRYLLFVGQFASWVDFDTLLKAFALVAHRQRDVRLLLVGDGAERPRIGRIARELGIEDAIVMTGYVRDRDRVRDLLAASTVAVASHRGEHLNRIGMNATKLAEYIASGRAVVAKDVARLREMIDDPGAGTVVPGDPGAMAEAISSLLEPGRADELGATGRKLAEDRYSWDSTIARTLPLFGWGR
jgi:glycosyltransferase involved in cell wall biosynthesis